MICELDCFECPYADCIADADIKIVERKYKKERKKLERTEEQREKYLAYCKNYYQENKEHLIQIKTEKRKKDRENAQNGFKEDLIDFGKWLSFEREARELNQKEFGRLLGMDYTAISQFELGRRKPNWDTFNFMLNKLGYELQIARKGN